MLGNNDYGWTPGKAKREAALPAPTGSAENVQLSNDTKIRFCNTFDAIKAHVILCKDCDMYLRWGDGDLCSAGKTIIAMEMAYAETTPEFPPNEKLTDAAVSDFRKHK